MQPTCKFRFVKRETKHYYIPTSTTAETPFTITTEMVLQQWWESEFVPGRNDEGGEWRDVPVENEP